MQTRRAEREDAPGLAALHIKSWQQAYQGILPEEFLASLDAKRREDAWLNILGQGDDGPSVMLDCEPGGELAGFACYGASRDNDAGAASGELQALYYLREYWGSGRAGRLWHIARGHMLSQGFRDVSLWVLRDNHRAITFYRKLGFRRDGASRTDVRGDIKFHEVRMTLENLQ